MTIQLLKGKTESIQCSFDKDLTDWRIRVRITDNKNHLVRKASLQLRYGAVEQISIDEDDHTIFYVHLQGNETIDFDNHGEFEIEIESSDQRTMHCHVDKIKFL